MGVKYDEITGMPSNDHPDYNKLLEMWRDEKNKRQEAEGELTIIKGIGNTSPEMKTLQERVKQLNNSLAIALEIDDKHQRYNGELQTRVTELEEDNKKLAQQVEDKIDQMRRSGM